MEFVGGNGFGDMGQVFALEIEDIQDGSASARRDMECLAGLAWFSESWAQTLGVGGYLLGHTLRR